MFDRNHIQLSYCYGFNGMEKDDEHTQGKYDFGARIYDSRLGRWLSPDVYESRLAYSSRYSFAVNKPIIATDPNGEFVRFLNESGKEAFTENLKNLTSSDIKLQQELLGALETTKARMTIEKRDPDTDTWHAEPTIEGIEVTFIGKNVHALTKKVVNSDLSDEAKTKLFVQLSYLTSSDALVEIEGVDPKTQVNYSTNKTDGKENTPSTLSSSRYSITSKSRMSANGRPLNDAEVNELTNNGAGAGHPNGDAHRAQNIRTTFEVLEGSQWIKKTCRWNRYC
jgi:RHS repeat-associated protein